MMDPIEVGLDNISAKLSSGEYYRYLDFTCNGETVASARILPDHLLCLQQVLAQYWKHLRTENSTVYPEWNGGAKHSMEILSD